ncbi:MAG: TraB/GumN family protein [Erysipelotrichaceae bacterium]|nr:TraB/GumN family protein [Erysipelotrichaceae bacterium]
MDIEPVKLEYEGKQITLIPTAHVSKNSAELVSTVIDELQPDTICIELDQSRYESLKDPEKFKNTDVVKIIKEKKVGYVLANLILGSYQKKLAKHLGSQTGNEMMVAMKKAEESGKNLVLADRNIQTTFKRCWRKLTAKDKIKLINVIVSSIFEDEEISEEELKNLQQSHALTAALDEIGKVFPNVAEVLITERDKYLAYKIKNAPGNNIVAVMGAAHTIGVQKHINENYDIKELDEIPPKSTFSKIIGWLIPICIVLLIVLSFSKDKEIGMQQLKTWILFNGTASALGALLAGGHIISILVAFVVAPITSLNPLLAAGWFAGLTEAYIRKPTVEDFQKVSDDLGSFKGFFSNRVLKVLMVVILANLGSTIGTFVSGLSIFSKIIEKL